MPRYNVLLEYDHKPNEFAKPIRVRSKSGIGVHSDENEAHAFAQSCMAHVPGITVRGVSLHPVQR